MCGSGLRPLDFVATLESTRELMMIQPLVQTWSYLYDAARSRWRNVWLRARGVRIEGYVWLRGIQIPREPRAVRLHGPCALDRGVVLLCSGEAARLPKIEIQRGVYINRWVFIDASERIEIGRDVLVGPYCYITDHDHGMMPGTPPSQQPLISERVRIGRGAWIGAHVTILKGVRIGEGAIIGAGSVVSRSIPANAIAVGNPARVLRMRHEAKE